MGCDPIVIDINRGLLPLDMGRASFAVRKGSLSNLSGSVDWIPTIFEHLLSDSVSLI
jgi:hypothetical protein